MQWINDMSQWNESKISSNWFYAIADIKTTVGRPENFRKARVCRIKFLIKFKPCNKDFAFLLEILLELCATKFTRLTNCHRGDFTWKVSINSASTKKPEPSPNREIRKADFARLLWLLQTNMTTHERARNNWQRSDQEKEHKLCILTWESSLTSVFVTPTNQRTVFRPLATSKYRSFIFHFAPTASRHLNEASS